MKKKIIMFILTLLLTFSLMSQNITVKITHIETNKIVKVDKHQWFSMQYIILLDEDSTHSEIQINLYKHKKKTHIEYLKIINYCETNNTIEYSVVNTLGQEFIMRFYKGEIKQIEYEYIKYKEIWTGSVRYELH